MHRAFRPTKHWVQMSPERFLQRNCLQVLRGCRTVCVRAHKCSQSKRRSLQILPSMAEVKGNSSTRDNSFKKQKEKACFWDWCLADKNNLTVIESLGKVNRLTAKPPNTFHSWRVQFIARFETVGSSPMQKPFCVLKQQKIWYSALKGEKKSGSVIDTFMIMCKTP